MRRTTRTFIVGCMVAAATALGSGPAFAQDGGRAEDGSRVSAGYYSDPTPVSEYERRLNRPGKCAEASAKFAAWKPGQPLPSKAVSDTMMACLNDAS